MNNTYVVIGIDPGFRGAVAPLYKGADKVISWEITGTPIMHVKKKKPMKNPGVDGKKIKTVNQTHYRKEQMLNILRGILDQAWTVQAPVFAVLERAHAMPGQGSVSMFTNGMGYGLWEMALIAMNIPYLIVHPSAWVNKMIQEYPEVAELEGKQRSIAVAKLRYPGVKLIAPNGRVDQDGWADALNLAHYGVTLGVGDTYPVQNMWYPEEVEGEING